MAVIDISPEILEDIESHFDTFYKNPKVKEIYKNLLRKVKRKFDS